MVRQKCNRCSLVGAIRYRQGQIPHTQPFTPVQYEEWSLFFPWSVRQSHISFSSLYRSNMILGFHKLSSSSTYRTKGFSTRAPWNQLHISTRLNWSQKLIRCQKVGGYTECDECLLKKNRLKYKMSRCCFNTLHLSFPSLLARSQSTQSIPSCHSVDRAAATLLLWHPSLLILVSLAIPHISLLTLVLSFLSMYPFSFCDMRVAPHVKALTYSQLPLNLVQLKKLWMWI